MRLDSVTFTPDRIVQGWDVSPLQRVSAILVSGIKVTFEGTVLVP